MHIPRKAIIDTISILSLVIFLSTARAEHVLPVFSGYWYTTATIKHRDGCGNAIYHYTNRFQGDPKLVVQQIQGDPPPKDECQWGDIERNSAYPLITPIDFGGTFLDWKEITKNSNAPVIANWGRNCIDKKGSVIYKLGILISPSYICPPGTKQGYESTSNGSPIQGCWTQNRICTADIAGRSLNIPVLGIFGHVGLGTFDHHSIIEVLSEPAGIFINDLNKFQHIENTPYWGEKYDLQDYPPITEEQAKYILQVGKDQLSYPFEYTATWDWRPGSDGQQQVYNQLNQAWETVNTPIKAKFRCDSFIYYCYLAAENFHIFPEFIPPLLPRDIFNAFSSCRDPEGILCEKDSKHNSTSSNIKAVSLESIFSFPTLDIQSADYNVQVFVKDEHIPRSIKLNQLWSLALKHQDNPTKFNYIIDSLDYLKPIELTTEMIQTFQAQTNLQIRNHLLLTLLEAAHSKNKNEADYTQRTNIIKIQNFVRDLLYHSKDETILRYAIRLYPSITTPKQARQDVEKALTRKDLKYLKPPLFSDNEKMQMNVELTFTNKEQQREYLPLLIKKNKSNEAFGHYLCFILYYLAPEDVDESVKSEIANQLELRKMSLLIPLSQLQLREKIPYCYWLSAYATVKTHTEKERLSFIFDYIRLDQDIFKQAELIEGLERKLIKFMPHEDVIYYRARFYDRLKNLDSNEANFDEKKRALEDGISSLYNL